MAWAATSWGPSPRERGAEELGAGFRPLAGTIPARGEQDVGPHVLGGPVGPSPHGPGSGTLIKSPMPSRRSHPRACGEQTGLFNTPGVQHGPSPRVQGAAARRREELRDTWTIPQARGAACADADLLAVDGTIPANAGSSRGGGVAAEAVGATRVPGGQRSSAVVLGSRSGRSPAGAGNSRTSCRTRSAPRGHPRGRGEQMSVGLNPETQKGPSPRRQEAVGHAEDGLRPGTIPRRRGNSRGEYLTATQQPRPPAKTPNEPHTLTHSPTPLTTTIPARAESSRTLWRTCARGRGHPRRHEEQTDA